MNRTAHPTEIVSLRISATIANEYEQRCPDCIPEACWNPGRVSVTLETAKAILADAEFNSDKAAQDIGPYGMPLGTFNAYRALAKQARAAITKAEEVTA